jgi:peptide/nickel transport system permease protein
VTPEQDPSQQYRGTPIDRIRTVVSGARDNYLYRNVLGGLQKLLTDRVTKLSLIFLLIVLFFGAFGPYITPYQYDTQHYDENGDIKQLESPSVDHPLGTTQRGEDVLSRIIYGARPTVVSGLVGGAMIIGIGMTIGLTAGYVGGRVESALMRTVDFWFAIPLLPFAITAAAFIGIGFWTTIGIIGIILWRGNARLLRSQVLQIKERPFIKSAQATGASTPRIIIKHILPNTGGMVFLFFALGIGWSITTQASLAFLGLSDPFVPSWGVMLRNAYTSGLLHKSLWWALPPGFLISFTVLSTFMIGRGYEQMMEGQQDDAGAIEM